MVTGLVLGCDCIGPVSLNNLGAQQWSFEEWSWEGATLIRKLLNIIEPITYPPKNGWFMILKYMSIPQEWPAISGSQGHWSGALYFYHELRDESSWQRGDLENRMPRMSSKLIKVDDCFQDIDIYFTGAFYVGNEGMIPVITSNNHPHPFPAKHQ